MCLVLFDAVIALLEMSERAYDLGDEVRELEEWQHGLSADLPHEVGSTGAVCANHLDVSIEPVFDAQ